MSSRSDDLEIVRVISAFRLLDTDSYERVYWRRDGKPLALGWYLVSWPGGISRRRFNEDARFRGPYRDIEQARAAREQLLDRARTRANAELPALLAPPRREAQARAPDHPRPEAAVSGARFPSAAEFPARIRTRRTT
ncbi:MAG TPA: hypothetical protein VLW45_04020 [Pelomicrobium sp.]|nr:hypothetical protein [Pelomicrobium sp.]